MNNYKKFKIDYIKNMTLLLFTQDYLDWLLFIYKLSLIFAQVLKNGCNNRSFFTDSCEIRIPLSKGKLKVKITLPRSCNIRTPQVEGSRTPENKHSVETSGFTGWGCEKLWNIQQSREAPNSPGTVGRGMHNNNT